MTTRTFRSGVRFWDWVHPSQRDLVIDQLSSSAKMSEHYIRNGGLPAISLALSQGGGSSGERKFPLLTHAGSWEVLEEACIASVRENPIKNSDSIFTALESAASTSITTDVRKLVFRVCSAVRDHWDRENIVLTPGLILKFIRLSGKAGKYVRSPALQTSWQAACKQMTAEAKEAEDDGMYAQIDHLENWIAFVDVVRANEPRLVLRGSIETRFDASIGQYIQALQSLLDSGFDADDPEEYQSESERSTKIARTLDSLIPLFPSREAVLNNQIVKFQERTALLEEEADELKNELGLNDGDDDGEAERSHRESSLDLDLLFEDL